jgi:peptidoglycan/LPS O-acetylase OafA/YrhL
MKKNEYVKHIDGLRAIAVLSVIFFHLNFSLFSGGFVGVDIFFVISGFLITRLIKKEIEATNSFNFLYFYSHRIKRLLPAIFFMFLLTIISDFSLFFPKYFSSFGASLAAAGVSASNFYFWYKSGYFDALDTLKPLLHTWSLGVEEQFYILWPLLMLLILDLKKMKPYFPFFILFLFVISLGLSLIFIQHIYANFYLVPFRIFEFAIGAFTVQLTAEKKYLRIKQL